MKPNRRTNDELVEYLIRGADDDVLADDYPMDLVRDELRGAGADPDAIMRRGAKLGIELEKRRRLAWQEEARAKIQKARDLEAARSARAAAPALSREELVLRIEQAQRDPRLGGQLQMAARNMELLEQKSLELLHEELADLEALAEMSDMFKKSE